MTTKHHVLTALCTVAALALGGGCVATGIGATEIPVNPPPRAMAARAPATVQMFTSGQPSRPHVDVAILQTDGVVQGFTGTGNSAADVVGALRSLAAAKGCDGVVVTQLNVVSYDKYPNSRIVTGTCIVFTGP